MDLALRLALKDAIGMSPDSQKVIRALAMDSDGEGFVEYEPEGVQVDSSAPGFTPYRTKIGDEEMVRAFLLTSLVGEYGYPADPSVLQVERTYKSVGRPGKGGRVDLLLRRPSKGNAPGPAFMFIECKAPSEYDHDFRYIDGQLFRLSLQEVPRPRYLVYYTVEASGTVLKPRTLVIDTTEFGAYEDWDVAGQPIVDVLPTNFGKPLKRKYGNVDTATSAHQPLDVAVRPEVFTRLQTELHDVIWGGGGTNNNEVFVYITKLILAKIYDEHMTPPGASYEFQRFGSHLGSESPGELANRMNALYRDAENSYLALPTPSEGPAFDTSRVSAEKIAFVVGRLESLSITKNVHPDDLLGEFFEHIVAQDFTQTKGQFFTPMKIVRFMLELSSAVDQAEEGMLKELDANGRPMLPRVIDPSCGAGSFLIEYMRQVGQRLGTSPFRAKLAPRLQEFHDQWFGGSGNRWAQHFLYGVENNYDLGLAAKVNMVLHGDGSMNTWIASGLAPFSRYAMKGRENLLSLEERRPSGADVYGGPLNQQFDLIISNPPFSLKLPDDERQAIADNFVALPLRISEALFIERWYQLLRPGGRICCILPESLLDTSQNEVIRRFLVSHFRILAIVSLPYDAFRPFTSTKTAIVLAEKRNELEIREWEEALAKASKSAQSHGARRDGVADALESLGWNSQGIFMAEPENVGYKRRKNLPDLLRPNDLVEGALGSASVISSWRDPSCAPSSVFGFRTTLREVVKRPGLRLDPKYRWLWDFQEGLVTGGAEVARPLGEILDLVNLRKVKKGELGTEARVIDLEHVERGQALLEAKFSLAEELGSDKVSFAGAELAFSKLEPYLGKIIESPPQDALGSTEWIGLTRKVREIPLIVVTYLLLLPESRDAYRRLQAGKRHARLVPQELLDLRFAIPEPAEAIALSKILVRKRGEMIALRAEALAVRGDIDLALREGVDAE